MDANRKTAFQTLMDIENQQAYSNLALNRRLGEGRPTEPAFVRELVYGVLENKLLLDYQLDSLVKKGLKSLKKPDLTILRMGLYQIAFMDSVPPYAAVNESVTLAKKFARGRDGFVNGVLRSFLKQGGQLRLPEREKDVETYLSIKYSYASWIVRLWRQHYEEDVVESLLAAGNETPDLVLRCNTLKTTPAILQDTLLARDYVVLPGYQVQDALRVKGSGLLQSDLYQAGFFSVQGEASQKVVNLLDPQPGEVLVDCCAAPGGKTMAAAEKMKNKGQIYAWDYYENRVALIEKEAQRLGISIVTTGTQDATQINPAFQEKADGVLVDAPCSGLGVLSHKPESKYKEEDAQRESLPEKQLAILTAAATYVKPGGRLVYSTCTINPCENQDVVDRFLKTHPHFQETSRQQLLPFEDHTDGFFMSRLERRP